MALSLAPFAGARIAVVATSLIGDIKGEWYSESATEALSKAASICSTPDTYVDVFNTNMLGERTDCTARVSYNQVTGACTWHSFVSEATR